MQSQNIYGWFLIGTSARNKYGNYGAEIYDEKNPLKAFFGTSEEKSTDDYGLIIPNTQMTNNSPFL